MSPYIECPCGCGRSFSSIGSRGRPRSYFSPGCSLRVNNFSLMNGGSSGTTKKPVQTSLLNPFFGRRHSLATRTTLSEKASVPKPWIRGERNGMAGRTGDRNPRYVDGSSPERNRLYASKEWRELVRIVRDRDGYRCQRCAAEKHGRRSLHLHHIKPWAGNPESRFDPDNIITLCASCHRKEHRKEVRYQ